MFKHDPIGDQRAELIERILMSIAMMIILVCLMYQFVLCASLPYVYIDTATDKCMYVEYSNGTIGNCDRLPERYTVKYTIGRID